MLSDSCNTSVQCVCTPNTVQSTSTVNASLNIVHVSPNNTVQCIAHPNTATVQSTYTSTDGIVNAHNAHVPPNTHISPNMVVQCIGTCTYNTVQSTSTADVPLNTVQGTSIISSDIVPYTDIMVSCNTAQSTGAMQCTSIASNDSSGEVTCIDAECTSRKLSPQTSSMSTPVHDTVSSNEGSKRRTVRAMKHKI